jgi:hypothetical protein
VTSIPPEQQPWYERETPSDVLRRIRRNAYGAYAVFAVLALILGTFRDFLGLTGSAAVTMISFLWLEEIVEVVLLQPVPHQHARKLMVRTLARFALLGVSLTVTIIIARFNASSVLPGFSIIVVGIIGEALYSLYREVARR